MATNEKNLRKVVTGPNTRWSYLHVFEPRAVNGGDPKYSGCFIIPKSDVKTVESLKAAIKAAYEEGESKLKGNNKVAPSLDTIKTPLRDGDKERPGDPVYANAYFVNANSTVAPGIVDINRLPIIDPNEIYSGVYGRVSLTCFAFNHSGNRGIACGLNNLQKVKDGERLGGRSSPDEDFASELGEILD